MPANLAFKRQMSITTTTEKLQAIRELKMEKRNKSRNQGKEGKTSTKRQAEKHNWPQNQLGVEEGKRRQKKAPKTKENLLNANEGKIQLREKNPMQCDS